MKSRVCILASLWIGAGLLVVLLVFGSLWIGLGVLGDETGSQIAEGVALGVLICWGLDFVWLVVLLALAQLAATKSTVKTVEENEQKEAVE